MTPDWLDLADTERKQRRENACPCCLTDSCPCELEYVTTVNTPFVWCSTHVRECTGEPPDPYDNPTEAWPEVRRWF